MKYWVRENGAAPFHGPLSLAEVAAGVRDGRFSPACELLEATGQSHGALKRATDWRPVGEVELPPPTDSAGGASLPPSTAEYTYRVLPLSIATNAVGDEAQLAADRVGRLVAEMAAEGWDFYRVETVGVLVRPGCLGPLLGQTSAEKTCYLAVFRRPAR